MLFRSRRRADYTPETYSGEILLFRTRGASILNELLIHMTPGRSAVMDSLGWSLVADQNLNIISVPGQHSNFIFVPHAATVAAKLRAQAWPVLQPAVVEDKFQTHE